MKKLPASVIVSALTAAAMAVPVCAASVDAAPLLIFGRGVYAAWKDGKIVTYYVFNDGSSGRTADARLGIGMEFQCEQTEDTVVFRMADSNKSVVMRCTRDSYGDPVGTFEDTGETYTFIWVENSDPDTFEIIHRENGYFSFEDGVWEMKDAGEEFAAAESAAGSNAGILLDYVTAMIYGFDLTFTFTLDDGSTVERSMAYDGRLDSSGLFIGVHDLLDDSYVSAEDIASLAITDNSGGSMESVSIGTPTADRVTVRLEDTDAAEITAYDEPGETAEPAEPVAADLQTDETFAGSATTSDDTQAEVVLSDNAEEADIPADEVPTANESVDTQPAETPTDTADEADSTQAAEEPDDSADKPGPENTDNDTGADENGNSDKPNVVLTLPDGSVVVSLPTTDRNPITGIDDTAALAVMTASASVMLLSGKRRGKSE